MLAGWSGTTEFQKPGSLTVDWMVGFRLILFPAVHRLQEKTQANQPTQKLITVMHQLLFLPLARATQF